MEYVRHTSRRLHDIFNGYSFNKGEYHTYDYAQKKAFNYAEKYKVSIHECSHDTKNLDAYSLYLINQHLDSNSGAAIGFFAYDKMANDHIDAFIVHDKKILVLKTSQYADKIQTILENSFPDRDLYTQKLIPKDVDENHYFSAYHYPQQDFISCPVFALKYLKECLRDNTKMLSDIVYLDAGDGQSFKINQFTIHPYIERYSQSDRHYNKAKEYWKTHNKSTESNALLSKADAWRSKYDKSRMVYYLLKDLNKDMGYNNLEKIKTDIINYKHDDNKHSDDKDNFF